MDPPVVYIEKEPFLNMVLASVETFKRECVGYIFGHKPTRERNSFVIISTAAIKLAKKRKNSEVEQTQLSGKSIDDCFKKYPSLFRVIGDFHSHPEWGSCKGWALPTKRDLKNMEKEELSVIIAISSINKDRILWQSASDGGIRGSLSKYKFHFNVFRLVKKGGKLEEELLIVQAPAAIKALNRALGYK